MSEREVGVPEGEHTYTEQVVRFHYADGTIEDGDPWIDGERTPLSEMVGKVGKALGRPATPAGTRREVLTRKVTTFATPWIPLPDPEPEEVQP